MGMESAEIIVAGGGSAGCAIAARLAQAGVKVLLLEAGKTDRHYKLRVPALTSSVVQNTDFDWKYLADPDPTVGGRVDVWAGGKRLGGGSAINGMMYVRGHRWDYDHWVQLGARGWSYDELLPYFRRMETNSRGADAWRGGSGPIGVSDSRVHYPIIGEWVESAVACGISRVRDHNGERPGEGTDYAQVTQRDGLRSAASSYLSLPGVSANLTVHLEARVRRVLIEDGRAAGVLCDIGGRTTELRAQYGVVMSCGSLNTPRLLMLSGIGPAAHLREMGIDVLVDLPGVGGNLQEHVGTHLVNEVNTPTINTEAHGFALLRNLLEFALERRGILTTAVGHAQAFIKTRADAPAPNIQLSFTAFAFDLDREGKLVLRRHAAVSTVICVARPQSRGRVTLRSNDPLAPPVIRHRLLGVEDDVQQIVEGIAVARQIMAQPRIARFVTAEARPGTGVVGEPLAAHVRLASIPFYHPVGTCRMGTGEDAVVDADLAVRGVAGLWVADASVMPTLPVGNTNATAIVIGEKGTDHVLGAIRRSPGG